MTIKETIIKVLEDRNDWVPSYDLIAKDTPYGFLGSSADRRAYELTKTGDLEMRKIGKYAHFRINRKAQQELF